MQPFNLNIFQLWSKLWPHLSLKRRGQFFVTLIVVIFSSAFEVINIGAIVPFLGVLSNADDALKSWNSNIITSQIYISDTRSLILFFAISFCVICIFIAILRFTLLYCQIRFSYGLMADFGAEMYRRTLHQDYLVHVSRNSSQIISGVSGKAGALVGNGVLPSLVLMSSSIMIGIIFLALIMINPFVAIGSVISFCLIYFSILSLVRERIEK